MQTKTIRIWPAVSFILFLLALLFLRPFFAEGAPAVRTDKEIYNEGEMIQVYFAGAPGYNSDWICIVPAGARDNEPGDYKYMPSRASQGLILFSPRPPGQYEVRAYYNYRRNGYVVKGRQRFSVASDPVAREAPAPLLEPVIEAPPPFAYIEPPLVVVLPGTDIYVAPHLEIDLYFQGGWWWRQWRGHWYRSRIHDHGWQPYRDYPLWHRKIPHDWRNSYHSRTWGSRPWNPPRIHQGTVNRHWRDGRWRDDHGLGRSEPAKPTGKPALRGGDPGKPHPPGVFTPRSDSREPALRDDRPAGKSGADPGRGSRRGEEPGGDSGRRSHGSGPREDKPGFGHPR